MQATRLKAWWGGGEIWRGEDDTDLWNSASRIQTTS